MADLHSWYASALITLLLRVARTGVVSWAGQGSKAGGRPSDPRHRLRRGRSHAASRQIRQPVPPAWLSPTPAAPSALHNENRSQASRLSGPCVAQVPPSTGAGRRSRCVLAERALRRPVVDGTCPRVLTGPATVSAATGCGVPTAAARAPPTRGPPWPAAVVHPGELEPPQPSRAHPGPALLPVPANVTARHPGILAAQRMERARSRSEKGIRWGGRPRPSSLTNPATPYGHGTGPPRVTAEGPLTGGSPSPHPRSPSGGSREGCARPLRRCAPAPGARNRRFGW